MKTIIAILIVVERLGTLETANLFLSELRMLDILEPNILDHVIIESLLGILFHSRLRVHANLVEAVSKLFIC